MEHSEHPRRGDKRFHEGEPRSLSFSCDAMASDDFLIARKQYEGDQRQNTQPITEPITFVPDDSSASGEQLNLDHALDEEQINKAGGGDRAYMFEDLQAGLVVDGVSSVCTGKKDTEQVIPVFREILQAIQTDTLLKTPEDIVASLRGHILGANNRLYNEMTRDGDFEAKSMTVTLSFIHNGRLYSLSIGDSYTQHKDGKTGEITRLHPRHTVLSTWFSDQPGLFEALEQRLRRVQSEEKRAMLEEVIAESRPSDYLLYMAGFGTDTLDQSLVNYLMKYAFATKTFVRDPEMFHREADVCISIVHKPWNPGDMLVMHSDGIDPETMKTVLAQEEHPDDVVDQAFQRTIGEFVASAETYHDDAAALCFRCDEE